MAKPLSRSGRSESPASLCSLYLTIVRPVYTMKSSLATKATLQICLSATALRRRSEYGPQRCRKILLSVYRVRFLAHRLRPKSNHIYLVIALSADCQESSKELCLSAGMNGFLTKPMRPGKLSNAGGNKMLTLSVLGDLPSLLRTYAGTEISASASL